MKNSILPRRLRAAVLVLGTLVLGSAADLATASRAGGAAAPAASAVRATTQQPAHLQADESASLRQGTIAAVDPSGMRVQVQGIWLDLVEGRTQLVRNGQAARLATLKAGESIRFTVMSASGAAAPALQVIYAP